MKSKVQEGARGCRCREAFAARGALGAHVAAWAGVPAAASAAAVSAVSAVSADVLRRRRLQYLHCTP